MSSSASFRSPLLGVVRAANPSPLQTHRRTCQGVVLCPVLGPHCVTLNWNSQGREVGDDVELQSNAFELLCQLDPVGQYNEIRARAREHVVGQNFGFLPFLLDSARVNLGDDGDFHLEVFFLGAENRFGPAVELFRGLQPNRMVFHGLGRGPILVTVARWIEADGEEDLVFCDLPESVIRSAPVFRELKLRVGGGVERRYRDAGLISVVYEVAAGRGGVWPEYVGPR